MPIPAGLSELLPPGARLRSSATGLPSSIEAAEEGAPYDRHARIYDRVVGSSYYNRLVWRADVADYTAFAAEAVDSARGPYLDAGCGTAVFTAPVYRDATRPVVLVDRSTGMLSRALARIGDARTVALQADLEHLPTANASFETIGCFAMLHVLERPWDALQALRPQLRPGGGLFASMLVLGAGRVADGYLGLLHRRGELGALRTTAEFGAAARDAGFTGVAVEQRGAMAYVRASG